MAGRGVIIRVEVISGSLSGIISLPVALHSPLQVLREQLEELTNIPSENQVLILCNLEDRERNSDVLLDGRDHLSLREIGIINGSYLTLHPLGQQAQNSMQLRADLSPVHTSNSGALSPSTMSSSSSPRALPTDQRHSNAVINSHGDHIPSPFDDLPTLRVDTAIKAAEANHSYNGVIFDVVNKGPFEIQLNSISFGGMLGRIRIFVRDRSWSVDNEDVEPTGHWWAHRESISTRGWRMIVDRLMLPSWDRHAEIMFDVPVVLLPHSRRGIYCHSSLPDDLGIQYQSYQQHSRVAESEHLYLTAGLGHTGCVPFDDNQGWYRSYRGLAGSLSYKARLFGWSPSIHTTFPQPLRDAVRTMLLCQNRHMHGNGALIQAIPGGSSTRDPSVLASSSAYTSDDVAIPAVGSPCPLARLPKDAVYHIMEYMHWDWFEDIPKPSSRKRAASRAAGSGVEDAKASRNETGEPMSPASTRQNLFARLIATLGLGQRSGNLDSTTSMQSGSESESESDGDDNEAYEDDNESESIEDDDNADSAGGEDESHEDGGDMDTAAGEEDSSTNQNRQATMSMSRDQLVQFFLQHYDVDTLLHYLQQTTGTGSSYEEEDGSANYGEDGDDTNDDEDDTNDEDDDISVEEDVVVDDSETS